MNVIIVLPTYNEFKNIQSLIPAIFDKEDELKKAQHSLSILVVDDRSPDGTADIVKLLQKKYKNLFLIDASKRGLGDAYRRGIAHALDWLKAEIVVTMDADWSHRPDDLVRLIRSCTQPSNFVIGSRYIQNASTSGEWGRHRRINSRFANALAHHWVGLANIQDCTSGFRAIHADVLKKIPSSSINVNGYVFNVNLLYLAKKIRASIIEVPIYFDQRKDGKSKLGLSDIAEFFLFCITTFFQRKIGK